MNLPVHPVALTTDDARTLTDRIKVGVEAVWELIVQAYQGGAHRALGYSSWDDYCTREFGTARIRLPKEDRREVVASLRDSGLSTRAIAAATGLDRKTVMADLEVGENGPPDVAKVYDPTPVAVDPETGEIVDPAERITGTDGKSYLSKDRAAVRARRKRIRELVESKHSARQIADLTGLSYEAVLVNIKAMGLTPAKSRDHGGRRLAAGDGIEKFVTAIATFPVAVRSLRPSEAAADERRAGWVSDIDAAIKSLRSLRAELTKGDDG